MAFDLFDKLEGRFKGLFGKDDTEEINLPPGTPPGIILKPVDVEATHPAWYVVIASGVAGLGYYAYKSFSGKKSYRRKRRK